MEHCKLFFTVASVESSLIRISNPLAGMWAETECFGFGRVYTTPFFGGWQWPALTSAFITRLLRALSVLPIFILTMLATRLFSLRIFVEGCTSHGRGGTIERWLTLFCHFWLRLVLIFDCINSRLLNRYSDRRYKILFLRFFWSTLVWMYPILFSRWCFVSVLHLELYSRSVSNIIVSATVKRKGVILDTIGSGTIPCGEDVANSLLGKVSSHVLCFLALVSFYLGLDQGF